jgi:hypothetical protein
MSLEIIGNFEYSIRKVKKSGLMRPYFPRKLKLVVNACDYKLLALAVTHLPNTHYLNSRKPQITVTNYKNCV